jgi:hypothetical protein
MNESTDSTNDNNDDDDDDDEITKSGIGAEPLLDQPTNATDGAMVVVGEEVAPKSNMDLENAEDVPKDEDFSSSSSSLLSDFQGSDANFNEEEPRDVVLEIPLISSPRSTLPPRCQLHDTRTCTTTTSTTNTANETHKQETAKPPHDLDQQHEGQQQHEHQQQQQQEQHGYAIYSGPIPFHPYQNDNDISTHENCDLSSVSSFHGNDNAKSSVPAIATSATPIPIPIPTSAIASAPAAATTAERALAPTKATTSATTRVTMTRPKASTRRRGPPCHPYSSLPPPSSAQNPPPLVLQFHPPTTTNTTASTNTTNTAAIAVADIENPSGLNNTSTTPNATIPTGSDNDDNNNTTTNTLYVVEVKVGMRRYHHMFLGLLLILLATSLLLVVVFKLRNLPTPHWVQEQATTNKTYVYNTTISDDNHTDQEERD